MPETENSMHYRFFSRIVPGIVVVCAFIAGQRWIQSSTDKLSVPQALVPAELDGGKLLRKHDATELFQRAFWKRPSPSEKILHAERREWTAETGDVRRWQWFLAIEPSAGFVEDLKNRFSLEPGIMDAQKFSTAPKWFRNALTTSATILRTRDDSMILVQSADQKLLLATGAGGGFSLPQAAR